MRTLAIITDVGAEAEGMILKLSVAWEGPPPQRATTQVVIDIDDTSDQVKQKLNGRVRSLVEESGHVIVPGDKFRLIGGAF